MQTITHIYKQYGLSRKILASALILSVMTGCISTQGIHHDQSQREAKSLGAQGKFDQWPVTEWWQSFNDPALNQLIEQALRDNPNVVIAAKRMESASAYANAARSAIYPQVNGSVDISRQRLSENSFYPPPYGGSYQNIANGSLNASWDLDFWGKNRSALQSALSQTEAAQAEIAAAKLMISTAVAQTYYHLAQQVEQQKLAAQTLKQREQELSLVNARIKTGLDTNVELQQGKGNLASARVDVQTATESVELSRNALAALTLQSPQTLNTLEPALPAITVQALPDDIPIDLIARRPDLAAANARVNAATADIAVTHADFYPNVSLSAMIGLSSFGLSKFLESGSTVLGVGPAIHLPIFDAGKLRAQLQIKNTDLDIAIASYNQVLVEAIHDIADQMTSIQNIRLQSTDQQAALSATESAYKLSTIRYEAGLTNYLTVLTAEDALIRERSRSVNLQARTLDLNIALIRSLGGGYSKPEAVTNDSNHRS
ncbi:MAG: efflux transporter outer membrane subunit [Methylophilaceae bacterium]|nr:efflux transporter outer membrane subunit [Methyloradius sp.]